MAGDGSACTGEQIEQGNIRESHVERQHRFDLVFRPHPVNNGQGGIKWIKTGLKCSIGRVW
jgi:hypothetical protein